MLTLLGTDDVTAHKAASADDDGGGHDGWPIEAKGSLLVTGLEK